MAELQSKKTTLSNSPSHPKWLLTPAIALTLALNATSLAQEYEYEPDEGLHEEEWYDPSDWFDTTPGIDYEQDWWDTMGWGNNDWDADTWDDDTELGDYGVNTWSNASIEADDNTGYGWHYDFNPINGEWTSDYGYHERTYNFDAPNDFGWHYDWNPNTEEWESDYGWHASNYDYDFNRFNYSQDRMARQEGRAGTLARQNQQRDQERAREGMAQTRNRHTVTGRLESTKRISGQNGEPRHLARVRLENGKRVIVDFGERTPSSLGVSNGDRVVMRGRTVPMEGREVFLAQQVRIGGRLFNVPGRSGGQADAQVASRSDNRQAGAAGRGPQQEEGSGQAQSGQVEISGRLRDLSRADLDGVRENHTLARVELQNGRQVIVDLGANFDQRYGENRVRELLRRSDEGDRIRIRGDRQNVNGRQVIRARQFRLEGRNYLQGQNSGRSR